MSPCPRLNVFTSSSPKTDLLPPVRLNKRLFCLTRHSLLQGWQLSADDVSILWSSALNSLVGGSHRKTTVPWLSPRHTHSSPLRHWRFKQRTSSEDNRWGSISVPSGSILVRMMMFLFWSYIAMPWGCRWYNVYTNVYKSIFIWCGF